MVDCLFCKIIDKTIPAALVFETDSVLAFKDIQPQAPHHILVIPKQHISTLNDLPDGNQRIISDIVQSAVAIAKVKGFANDGYRIVLNCNNDGGQSVFHIHLHLLGGRSMHWPPG